MDFGLKLGLGLVKIYIYIGGERECRVYTLPSSSCNRLWNGSTFCKTEKNWAQNEENMEKHLNRVEVASFNKDVGVLNAKRGKVRVFIYIDISFTWRLKYVIRIRTATKT